MVWLRLLMVSSILRCVSIYLAILLASLSSNSNSSLALTMSATVGSEGITFFIDLVPI
jgi:hypothetical protein